MNIFMISPEMMSLIIGIVSMILGTFILFVFRKYIIHFYQILMIKMHFKKYYKKFIYLMGQQVFNQCKIDKKCDYEHFFKYVYIENNLVSYHGSEDDLISIYDLIFNVDMKNDISLIGSHGMGKTLLCLRLMQYFPYKNKLCFYMNAGNFLASHHDSILSYLYEEFTSLLNKPLQKEDFIKKIKKYSLTLIIDGLNESIDQDFILLLDRYIKEFESLFDVRLIYVHDEFISKGCVNYRIVDLSMSQKYQLVDNLFLNTNQNVDYIHELKMIVAKNKLFNNAYNITLLYYINNSDDDFLSRINKVALLKNYMEKFYVVESNISIEKLKQIAFDIRFKEENKNKSQYFSVEDLYEYCLALKLYDLLNENYEENKKYIVELCKSHHDEDVIQYIFLIISNAYTKMPLSYLTPLIEEVILNSVLDENYFALANELIGTMKKEFAYYLLKRIYQEEQEENNILYPRSIYYIEKYLLFDVALLLIKKEKIHDLFYIENIFITGEIFRKEDLKSQLNQYVKEEKLQRTLEVINKIQEEMNKSLIIKDDNIISCQKEYMGHIILSKEIKGLKQSSFFNIHNLTGVLILSEIQEIPYNAFARCNNLKTIVFPSTLKEIQDFAFFKCESLKSIKLLDGVKKIGSWSFYWCYDLEEFNLIEGLIELGKSAFRFCYKLKELTLPKSLLTIGRSAFANCISLHIESNNKYFLKEKDGMIIDNPTKRIIFYPYDVKNSELKIKENIEEIDSWIFSNNIYLRKVYLPKSLKIIGRNPFECTQVEIINHSPLFELSDGVLFTKGKENLIYYPLYKTETKYSVPHETKNILEGAFSYQEYLEEIDLKNVITLQEFAFYFCDKLKIIHENELDRVYSYPLDGTRFFNEQPNLVILGNTLYYYKSNDITSVYIPWYITYIADYAFNDNENLESITVESHSRLEDIGANAFTNCKFFKIFLASNDVDLYVGNVLLRVKENTTLESYEVRNNCLGIAEIAFNNCTALKEVTLPNSLIYVSKTSFDGCTSLEKINYNGDYRAILERLYDLVPKPKDIKVFKKPNQND